MAGKRQSVTIDGETVRVTTKTSNAARSVDIEFKPGTITINIPKGADIDLEQLLTQKHELLTRKYREALNKKRILEDGTMLIQGTPRRITIHETPKPPNQRVTLTEDTLTIHQAPHENPAKTLKRWMIQQTKQLIHQTLKKHRDQLETPPEITRVADTARWGYCNKKGHIIYNYQLTALPPELAEYVIIHEAVHLTHFHHQKGFHHKLEQLLPDHRQHEKQLQHYLAIPTDIEKKADPLKTKQTTTKKA